VRAETLCLCTSKRAFVIAITANTARQ